MKIHSKLLTSLLLTALFPLFFIAVIFYFSSKSTLVRVAQDNLDFRAATLAQSVLDVLENKYTEVESWCRLDTLQAVFTGDDVDLRLGLLLRDLRDTSDFIEIWCVDTSGQVVASSDFAEVGSIRIEHPAIKAALGNTLYVSPVQERESAASNKSWIVNMSHPIVGAFDDETIIGALVATYDWGKVLGLVRSQTLTHDEGSQRVTLFDDASRIVATTDLNLMMTRSSAIRSATPESGNALWETEKTPRMITGVANVDSNRLDVHYTAEASVQERAVLATLREMELNVFIVCLLAIAAVVLFSIALSRSISSPIVRLSEAARRIAEGDLEVKPTYYSSDEIGTLASDLDAMRSNLKEQIDTLDSAVQERTRELESTVERLRQEVKDRIDAENQTKLHQQQLVQADKMVSLGILVSGVAHEINNPNALMGLNIPVIEDAWKKAMPVLDEYCEEHGDISLGAMNYSEMREHIPQLLSEMREGSNRIRAIVSDLKAFSRKHDEDELDALDMNQVVDSAINLVKKHIDDSTNNFTITHCENLPTVHGDSQRLEQVIVNLLLNACDALSDQESEIHLVTALDTETMDVRIEVTDEGCGITSENLLHVTDPFFTTKRATGGTGLGLSVSSEIVDEHGGTLRFESVLGEGTKVVLSLPRSHKEEAMRS